MAPPRTRTRLATLAVSAVLGSVVVAGCSDDATEATDPASSEPSGTTASVEVTPTPDAASTDATEAPPSSGTAEETVSVPVYLVGDTPMGPRLFREFHQVPAADPLTGAAAVLTSGEVSDPDYRSLLDGLSITSVTAEPGAIVVTVEPGSFGADLTRRETKLGLQSLVYTLQGTAQTRDRVFIRDAAGAAVPLLGVDTSEGLRNAKQLNVLALVNVTTPEEGAVVSGSFTATGLSSSFEASGPWELRAADGSVVKSGPYQAEGWMDKLYPWTAEVDLAGVAPGDYTFAASTDDPSGGTEGPGPTEDTKDITVQ